MKRFLLLAILLLSSFVLSASAQNLTVSGVVTSLDDGLPLPGVTIFVQGTSNNATLADIDGNYKLNNVPSNGYLEFRYVGMETTVIPVEGRTKIDLAMVTSALSADAVMVTALGVKKESKALGYAAQEVKGAALQAARTTNVTNALTGQVPGLQVVKGGGATGSSKIVLRGMSSLTGDNQPLIVVDGVPIDNFVGGELDMWGNSGVDFGNGLSDINDEDIESMTVLKGASAAALYGARAGNGVILITTKSGKSQDGLGITVQAGLAIEDIFVKPLLQDNFAQGYDGVYDNQTRASWGPEMNGILSGTNWKGENVVLRPYDNVQNFFRTGIIDTESITFQQKMNKTSVYASINRMNDASMVRYTNLNRTSITARATTNLGQSDKWTVDVKVNYINSQAQNRPTQGINQSNPFYTIMELPRSIDITDFEQAIDNTGKQIWWDAQNSPQDNPYWTAKYNQTHDTRNRFITFGEVGYQFTPWLKGSIRGGLDIYSTNDNRKKHSGGLSMPEGLYEVGMETFNEQNYSFLFVAQKDQLFGDFGGSVTFGGNMMYQNRQKMRASSGALLVPNLFSLNNGIDKPTINETLTRRRMNSLYGSLQVNWKRAIFLDATLRNDWSSTMSIENQSYLYPSVNLSVILSEFIDMPNWITFAKIRGSYAEVGNDLSPYQLYNNYNIGKDIWGNATAEPGTTLYNPAVRSELIKSWEAGLDFRFLNNRLRFDVSWYKTNATRQLLDIPLDPATGYDKMKINAGNIQNQGWEIAVGADVFDGPLRWTTTVNFSRNVNKIIELADGITEYSLGSIEDMRVIARAGGGYGEIYGSTIRRVEDKDSPYYGKVLLNENGEPVKGNVAYLGNQAPDALVGWNNMFSYKGVTLNMNFDARIGGKVYSSTIASLHKNGNALSTTKNGKRDEFVVDGVIQKADGSYVENTKPITPQRYYAEILGQGNYGIIEPYLFDATTVRLRTLSLGYEFPKKMLGKAVQRLGISATASNLWMIYSSMPGLDPESVSGTKTNATAIELGVPPTPRTFTFNVVIGF